MLSINRLKLAMALLLCLPFSAFAGKTVIASKNIAIQVQPQVDGTFQIFVKFTPPQFQTKVNIDHAVLTFSLILSSPITDPSQSLGADLLEIAGADASGKAVDTKLAYNANPVSARIESNKTGSVAVEISLAQLVEAWEKGTAANNGVLLLSHRLAQVKGLQSSKMALDSSIPAQVTIFWTEM